MNKSKMKDVIKYTIMENLKKKSIFVTTILVALVCVLVLPIIAFVSLGDNKLGKKNKTKIEKVYIYDTTEFGNVGYDSLTNMNKDYKEMQIEYKSIYENQKKSLTRTDIRKFSEEQRKTVKDNKGKPNVIVQITHIEKDSINVELTIPKDSKIKKSTVNILGNYINQLITIKKYELSAKDEDELLELMAGVNVSINTLGQGKDNEILSVAKIFVPLIFSFIMYFMLLTYGQSLCNGMITEKSSKIIELLVVHIRPSNLIIGKVIGQVIIAVGQIFVWAAAFLVGLKCANVYAINTKDKVFINVESIIDTIKTANLDSAFSISSIILAILLLLMGFVFYCVFAAICGSFINKPDEASSVFAIYTYTNVIGFMVVYLGTMMEKKSLVSVVRYIPFCTPYSVPADVILGEVSINQALIISLIMLICIVVIINVLGNVYERLVFNQLSVKELIKNRKI